MPGILVWNVENFGGNSALRGNYKCLLDFIAILVARRNADILVIQEFHGAGAYDLRRLRARLRRRTGDDTWNDDFLPGSLTRDTRPDVRWKNLGYTTAGNNEGYAVLWRHGLLRPLARRMSWKGRREGGQSYINLVTEGVYPAGDPYAQVPIFPSGGDTDSALGFPLPKCSAYGSVRAFVGRGRKRRRLGGWATITEMTEVRNPCYCEVTLDGGETLNLVVYHAPNGNPSSYYGALLSGLSRPLQGPGRAVIAGDFNVTANTQVPTAFSNIAALGMHSGTGNPGQFQRTMVRYKRMAHPVLVPRDSDWPRCMGSARDQIFYRLQAAPQAVGVWNLVRALKHGDDDFDAPLAQRVFASRAIRRRVERAVRDRDLPLIVRHSQEAVDDLLNSFRNNAFVNYRTVAIFLKSFISDHLPLFIHI